MNRKEFLTLLATATAGAPFLLNGLSVRAMNQFLDLSPNVCEGVKDRVLVIVRLMGGNDGLNTVIPVSQYDTYINLRPKIGIPKNQLQGTQGIDMGLEENKRVWFNPKMEGFRELYGSGKLALINGVGYPSPNYSHFMSENLMFSGRDGQSKPARDGMLGRYLANLFPEVVGCPVTEDPLAIVLGSPNSILFYEHECQNIEYNTSGIENTFFKQFENLKITASLQSMDLSEEFHDICNSLSQEYKELLQYIENVQNLSDDYYKRVMQVFDQGKNTSNVGYKNDNHLAKQLRIVARLIRGGSKTKIFQVNLKGFDTHVNQDKNHDDLLKKVSEAIMAFQKDIEGDAQVPSIADKIMMVTFSEFGRTAQENGNQGTDHGNLAPFFVIGKGANAGVYGEHPVLPDSKESTVYNAKEEIRYDYRQIFTTLIQDWLGAKDGIIDKMELNRFIGNKISLVQKKYNAVENNCLSELLPPVVAEKLPKISLYPNPVIESFTIKSGENRIQKIEIYNVIGALLVSLEVNYELQFTYNISHYKSGIYFVRIYAENQSRETIKIVKK